MKVFPSSCLLALALLSHARSAEKNTPSMLPEEVRPVVRKEVENFERATDKMKADLQLPAADEQILLRLPQRGFHHLGDLLIHFEDYFSCNLAALFTPEHHLTTHIQEEDVAANLLRRSMINRVLGTRLACYQVMKDLAPSPEAMKYEEQAKDLLNGLPDLAAHPNEANFVEKLDQVRKFYDCLKDLSKLTPEQLAKERAEAAVLAPTESQTPNGGIKERKREWAGIHPFAWNDLHGETSDDFRKCGADAWTAIERINHAFHLPIADQRIVLHLSKRGFRNLEAFVDRGPLSNGPGTTLFIPEGELESGIREEAIAEDILGQVMIARVAANRMACYRIMKGLAPTPEAMKFEGRAGELFRSLWDSRQEITEADYLRDLDKARAFYDQATHLPRLTAAQFAKERADSAVLALSEYNSRLFPEVPGAKQQWPENQLEWHRKWDHHGYLFAYSECLGLDDYEQLHMVVNQGGGIFEWNQDYAGSHFAPNSYESKLPAADLQTLKTFLATTSPSDADGKEIHYVISFLKDGDWHTRTYNQLPAGNPFEDFLKRMRRQSREDWSPETPRGEGLLKPLPSQP
jgi:hypothetical protein